MAAGERELLATLSEVRSKLRAANRRYGKQSTTLHLTRLERDQAQAQNARRAAEADAQAAYARRLYYMMRELFEVTRPGMVHGDFDKDYADALGSIRRMRAIVADVERHFADGFPDGDPNAIANIPITPEGPSPSPRRLT